MFNAFNRQQVPAGPNLAQYASAVEGILSSIGINATAAQMSIEGGYGWTFRRGSATIEVYVSQQEGVGYFQVLAPILHVPHGMLLPFYRRLLELNLQLTAAALGVYLDVVYVFSERPLEGMEPKEANSIINLVCSYADDLDDRLGGEFGARQYQRT
jgi:hypothetical protein